MQRSFVSRFRNPKLQGLNYWDKLRALRLYSQERRRDRYAVIFIWKISQGLVEGYTIPFTCRDSRTGRKAEPSTILQSALGHVKKARSASLAVRGSQMFNLLPANLRNSEHGDVEMFKNHLDIYLANIPDQPTVSGLTRGAVSNCLLHQIPAYTIP